MTPREGGRRPSARWADPPADAAPEVEVLIPTARGGAELAVTLAGLAAQDDPPFGVIVSDQSDDGSAGTEPAVAAMTRVLEAQGRLVRVVPHLPRRGLAEQRQFLFERSTARYVLYLDDDVWLEPGALARMHDAITTLRCGFVGQAPQGLSYLGDERPQERTSFRAWEGEVEPERLRADAPELERVPLHNAANLVHLARDVRLPDDRWLAYRVAWVGGCVLYDRSALADAGAFDFWRDVPPLHSGEDVAAEWRVMERRGGAGILPSGAVHLEAPTTIPDRPVDLFTLVLPDRDTTQRPNGRSRERRAAMADTPNPIQIQKFLGGIDYPASKDDIVRSAEESGADEPVLEALRGIPDDEYDGPTAVSAVVAR